MKYIRILLVASASIHTMETGISSSGVYKPVYVAGGDREREQGMEGGAFSFPLPSGVGHLVGDFCSSVK